MNGLKLNQNQFSDLINLNNKVFLPLINFVNKKDFETIIKKSLFNKKFFPYPIFFGVNKKNYIKYKNKKELIFFYKSKIIAKVNNINFFQINKKEFGIKIYGKNYKNHPYYKKFKSENYRFLNFDVKKIYKFKLDKSFFISPDFFKKQNKKKKLASFHTRNVPHTAHQWIHKYLIKKYNSLLIQPLIGQYKLGEYKDNVIIELNKKIVKQYKNKNVFVIPFFSYPRYGGPREASLHAIVRKNFGCSHFWVGRDHAGYKQFFKKYASQKFCKKITKKLKINIVAVKEPYYCSKKKFIVNQCSCKVSCKIPVSGSSIREMIKKNINIPSYLMSKKISKNLNKLSLIS